MRARSKREERIKECNRKKTRPVLALARLDLLLSTSSSRPPIDALLLCFFISCYISILPPHSYRVSKCTIIIVYFSFGAVRGGA